MGDWSARAARVGRLWPEALLSVITLWLVAVDGLRTSSGDPAYYFKIAGQVSQGQIPYRDFPWEYPPVSLPAVLLPYFAGAPSWESYSRLLFSENVVLLVAIGLGILYLAWRGWSAESVLRSSYIYVFLALALAPVVVWRYDALATLLSVLALVFAARRWSAASGVALGAGVMAKLYPLAMLPVLMLGQITKRGLRPAIVLAVACVATVLLIGAPFVIDSGTSAFSFLSYAVNRGVQIESVPGALALFAGMLTKQHPHIFNGFGTWQVESPLIPILASFWTLLTLVMLAALGIAIWHRYRADRDAEGEFKPVNQVIYVVAALVVVLVSSRIMSPQYLFWVAPFVALTSRPKTLVFWAACLATTIVYPINYQQYLNQEPYTVVIVNVRNAILVVFLGMLIWDDLKLGIGEVVPRLRALAGRSSPSSSA